ncbi:MAG: hypothetical protein LUC86_03700 [Prevotellaceae bacterium]|nr:hypothetical protein [Prevotellaceae bacterium]MCD8303918.1 hypothetical protein [Prevotellaceae bacterium]
MKKAYIRPATSVEQCEAKTGFSFNYSPTTTTDVWTKSGTGNAGSFDTSAFWQTEW